jgi:anthranilate/para-aminobenzoate synthase component II
MQPVFCGYNEHLVFVLDNYDSFTYNLVQYLGELGATIEFLPALVLLRKRASASN